MTNYNTLTPEQKESITPHLKGLFEERKKVLNTIKTIINKNKDEFKI